MKKWIQYFIPSLMGLILALAIGQIHCGRKSKTQSPEPLAGRYRDYNIIILVLDTLRANHLGCYGYFRSTSPRIDALSRQAVVFENAFASIPITLPSHVSILTGLYPQTAGILYNYGRLSDKTVTMAETLRQAGYRTAAVVSTAVLKKSKNLDQGFEEYYHNFGQEELRGRTAWEVKGIAEDANRLAFNWLEKIAGKEKFFLFINYYDIHAPYIEHEPFRDYFDPDSEDFLTYLEREWTKMPSPSWKRKVITFYDRSIAYTDSHIGKFWEKLEELGLRDRTIVIITSDHGNGLYQHHGYWSHGLYLYDEQIKIPLLILMPGQREGRKIGEIVETVDLLPTILDLVGALRESGIDGESMVPLLETGKWAKPDRAYAMRKPDDDRGRPLPKQFCVRTEKQKLISTLDGKKEYYNLNRDPYEKNNIYPQSEKEHGGLVPRLLSDGRRWFQLKKVQEIKTIAPDQQTLEELRSLGYVQ